MSGPQIWLCLFTFRPIASKQLNGLTTIDTVRWLGGAVVTPARELLSQIDLMLWAEPLRIQIASMSQHPTFQRKMETWRTLGQLQRRFLLGFTLYNEWKIKTHVNVKRQWHGVEQLFHKFYNCVRVLIAIHYHPFINLDLTVVFICILSEICCIHILYAFTVNFWHAARSVLYFLFYMYFWLVFIKLDFGHEYYRLLRYFLQGII